MIMLIEEFSEQDVYDIFDDVFIQFWENSDELGFDKDKVSKVLGWLNKNNRKTLGRCTRGNGRYSIELNPNILKFTEDGEKIIRETLAHELCHTLPGCFNHGKEFHNKADKIYKLMGYHIDTKADTDSSQYFMKYLPQTNYMLICDECGNQTPISKMSDPVKNPSNYSCKKCNGDLSSYKLNPDTGELELYKSSKDKPDYKYSADCESCDYSYPFIRKTKMFKDILHTIVNGGTVRCPKCHRANLYLIDDGREIHSDDFK